MNKQAKGSELLPFVAFTFYILLTILACINSNFCPVCFAALGNDIVDECGVLADVGLGYQGYWNETTFVSVRVPPALSSGVLMRISQSTTNMEPL